MLTLSVLSNCSHAGPDVTGCILDVQNQGFQCANRNTKYFLSFSQGKKLECISPFNAEAFLKACKSHELTPVEFCQLTDDYSEVKCYPPDGHMVYNLPIDQAENFFCISDQDFARIKERCLKK